MKFAIDRYVTGLEKEVSADDFDGQYYIPRKLNRFFCPECGLQVYWVSKGGNQPNKFKHPPRTENSPECDKRVDGRSELYLYEHVGLPVFLSHLGGNSFQLAISFPAVGNKTLATGAAQNAKVTIRGNGTSRTVPMNTNNFYPDSTTLIPVNFLPSDNGVFKIEVSPASAYSRKWSNYAEGFTNTGAIFTYDETGGKKVHRDDSISPGRQYYVVAQQFSCPYNEIHYKAVGTLKLQNCIYQVYSMTVNVSLQNEQRYSEISNFFRYKFKVGLLETAPEIIPLWPPVVQQDVLVPTKDTHIYCAISSGNDDPAVYSYVGNQVINTPVQKGRNGEKHIYFKVSTVDTVLSVDRKYVGREIIFRLKDIVPSRHQYEYSFADSESNVIQLDEATSNVFSTSGIVFSNAKMELYLGSVDHNYLHIPLRARETSLPTFQNLQEVLLLAEGSTIVSKRIQRISDNKYSENACYLESIIGQCYGEYVPVPRWAHRIIDSLSRNGSAVVAHAIVTRIVNGKLPIGVIRALEKLRRIARSG